MTTDLDGSPPRAVAEWTRLRGAVATSAAYRKCFSKMLRRVLLPDWGSSSKALYRFKSKSTGHCVDENDATAMASQFLGPPSLGLV
jgi:hypothetical protein